MCKYTRHFLDKYLGSLLCILGPSCHNGWRRDPHEAADLVPDRPDLLDWRVPLGVVEEGADLVAVGVVRDDAAVRVGQEGVEQLGGGGGADPEMEIELSTRRASSPNSFLLSLCCPNQSRKC